MGRIRGSRLLRRTFVFAAVLVSGGLIAGAVVELVFQYRQNVASVAGLPDNSSFLVVARNNAGDGSYGEGSVGARAKAGLFVCP